MRRFLAILGLWLPLLGYVALIYFFSSQSHLAWARYYPGSLLHALEFFLLAILVLRALNGGLLIPVPPRCYLWSFMLSSHYALLDEIHQALVPGRVASVFDLMADLVGIDVALAVVYTLQRVLATRRVGPRAG